MTFNAARFIFRVWAQRGPVERTLATLPGDPTIVVVVSPGSLEGILSVASLGIIEQGALVREDDGEARIYGYPIVVDASLGDDDVVLRAEVRA